MAKFIVPQRPGRCFVGIGPTGKPTVYNDQGGRNSVIIPCPSRDIAEEICRRINEADHNGQINVPNHG